ncbi:hypothetical protein [Candidatus Babela massiliensis]|uniref:Uncharacterized protein n=1 Tax=Candidatus Babela massiliensis TaxID=673862 RepID=V6DH93_9BACT|nr:hypothetical protein [Candidatus Babela massiliensis]CDK30930.1 hypothetical protein BABL1_gene_64 [Candidatus Babela massiliensis]
MYKYFLFLALLQYSSLLATSVVYNFRIAQITKQPIFKKVDKKDHFLIVGLIFDQYQQKYNKIYQNFAGGLTSLIYEFRSYFVRSDFASAHVKSKDKCKTNIFSNAQTDDILFTFGHNLTKNGNNTITLAGLLGIPTHKVFILQHADFGYGQVGTGLQFDGEYELDSIQAVTYGLRYIYFIPRKAQDLYKHSYIFTIGHMTDLLLAYKAHWTKHGLEFGYTARFQLGGRITPHFDNIIKKTNYIRSNFYSVYKYRFLIKNVANRFLLNFAYSFDHMPKIFGNRYLITPWASWNISF